MRTTIVMIAAAALCATACGKASKKDHKKACAKYADIQVASAVDFRVKDVAPDMKDKVRAEAQKELQGQHRDYQKRCLVQTKGAKKSFVKCMDEASSLTDLNRCVRNHESSQKRAEKRKRDKKRRTSTRSTN